jgi:hypothetical protein
MKLSLIKEDTMSKEKNKQNQIQKRKHSTVERKRQTKKKTDGKPSQLLSSELAMVG